MKAKIGVTVFQNGDMDILQASIYEEVWNDYQALRRRAGKMRAKGTEKGVFLSRRYERSALLCLYAFFEGVVDSWTKQLICRGNMAEEAENDPVCVKCRLLADAAYGNAYAGRRKDFSHLEACISRYEQHDLAFLEYVDAETLEDVEVHMNEYLTVIEKLTGLCRFPEPAPSTEELMNSLGGMVKACY